MKVKPIFILRVEVVTDEEVPGVGFSGSVAFLEEGLELLRESNDMSEGLIVMRVFNAALTSLARILNDCLSPDRKVDFTVEDQ